MRKMTNQEVGLMLKRRFDELKLRDGIGKAEFARQHGLKGGDSMISQHISGNRPIGIVAAMRYAKAFGCTAAEINPNIDDDIKQQSLKAAPISREEWDEADRIRSLGGSLISDKPGVVSIPQHREVVASMGGGLMLRDQPGQITEWSVTTEWANKNIPANTGKSNLRIVTGFGDSMRGMFNSGDPLLVDTGVRDLQFDGVYFFRIGSEGFIKRLQRIPGDGVRVISKNSDYETWTITPDMELEIFGRVVKVWKSEDL